MSTSLVPVSAAEAAGVVSERPALRILRPLAEPALLLEAQNRVREFVQAVLKEGVDYGVIPGTDGKALLKPGAEKITAAFGCRAVPRIIEEEIDHDHESRWTKRRKEWVTKDGRREQVFTEVTGVAHGLYRYVIACDIVDQDGAVRATGLGSCCSLESKYCDRPRDLENTILKMARKRSHVAGVLDAFGLSNQFNAVDLDDDEDGENASGVPETPHHPRGDTNLFPMPFGKSKGQALSDIDTKGLKGALDWNVRSCPTKYTDFQKEAKAELERRAVKADATLKGKAEPAKAEAQQPEAPAVEPPAPGPTFEDPPVLALDDQLPF